MQQPVCVRYALHVGGRDPYSIVDDAFLPLLVTQAAGGDQPASGSALRVTGAEVSAVQRAAGRIEVRVFNPTPDTTAVAIEGRAGWLVDLRGRAVAPFEETFDLGPWRIATAVLIDT
jgi:hypothetical protein